MLGFGDEKSTGRLYQREDLPTGVAAGVAVVGPITLAVDPVRRKCGLLVVASSPTLAADVESVKLEAALTATADDPDPAWFTLNGWTAVTVAGSTSIAIRDLEVVGMQARVEVLIKRAARNPVRIEFGKIKS